MIDGGWPFADGPTVPPSLDRIGFSAGWLLRWDSTARLSPYGARPYPPGERVNPELDDTWSRQGSRSSMTQFEPLGVRHMQVMIRFEGAC